MKELIKKLVETHGPSGSEESIQAVIRQEIKGFVDEVRVDALGNLIAIKKGRGGKKVMLAAHMDEIGLMVTHIDDKGFLRFAQIGGVSPFILLGQRVVFANGIVGVIGSEKIDDIKDLRMEKLFIDIGAIDRPSAEAKVKVGDSAGYWRPLDDLGNRLVAKSMDDRIGCGTLIEAARRLKNTDHEVYFVFTVQEEVGTRGARTAAFGLSPDLGIAVDVTRTGDTPKSITMEVALGKGAAIKVKDSGIIGHPGVKKMLVETARQAGIPYQMEVLEQGGTDAGPIQLTREGIPAGVISIPTRYIHSPSEMVDLGDVEAAVNLLVKVLESELAF
ncbi:MAG: M42 family metallopeptidase [Firmicutes bacterium]|nr:M42 family metallopeptidase [Bacillota bacterium]MCL5040431.1 M42 family metallopeptidase [Bacillota bacterium]